MDIKIFAVYMHNKFCPYNHTDQCAWQYEEQDNTCWERYSHAHWFRVAAELLDYLGKESPAKGVTDGP